MLNNELEQFYELCNEQVMLVETDLNANIIKVNKNYETFCSYSEDELKQDGFSRLRHPKIKGNFYKKMWEKLLQDGSYNGIFYNVSKNNKTIVSQNYIKAWKDTSGTVIGYKSLAIDITKEHQKNVALKKQQKYFQSTLNSLPQMLFISDTKEIIIANSPFLNFFGFSTLNAFIQENPNVCDMLKNKYSQDIKTLIKMALEVQKKESHPEIMLKNTLGEKCFFEVDALPILGSSKVIVSFYNITESYREKNILIDAVDAAEWELIDTQNEFLASKERFEYAINSSKDGFWDFDFRKNELYLSKAWKQRLGFEENEKITYLNYTNLICDDDLPDQINNMLDAIQKKKSIETSSHSFSIIYKIKTKSGEIVTIEDSGEILYNEDEDPYRIFGFHRDITQKLQEQQNLIQQSKLASLGEMIGNIAHQWRQPISAINGIINDIDFEIDLEGLDKVPSSRIKEVNADILEFTDYLSNTIDDFRNFLKEDKEKETFVLQENIKLALSIIEHSFTKEKISLIEDYSDEKILLNGYPRELNQVIVNILNNAKDAIKEKAIELPQVKLTIKADDDNIYLSISDNAGGVPEKIIDNIFDPYFTTKHESIGTGIGLSMSKNIIDNEFNGLLTVKNDTEGAVFKIQLPR